MYTIKCIVKETGTSFHSSMFIVGFFEYVPGILYVWKAAVRYVMFRIPPCCLYAARDRALRLRKKLNRCGSRTSIKKTFTLQLTAQCDRCVITPALATSVFKSIARCPLQ